MPLSSFNSHQAIMPSLARDVLDVGAAGLGIMNAFRGMSLEGSAGIAAVAPGVAEALITTVAGLAVAIPAVIAYNLLNRRVRIIVALIDRFETEFVRAAHYASRREGGAAAPPPPSSEPFFARRNA